MSELKKGNSYNVIHHGDELYLVYIGGHETGECFVQEYDASNEFDVKILDTFFAAVEAGEQTDRFELATPENLLNGKFAEYEQWKERVAFSPWLGNSQKNPLDD